MIKRIKLLSYDEIIDSSQMTFVAFGVLIFFMICSCTFISWTINPIGTRFGLLGLFIAWLGMIDYRSLFNRGGYD